ncbi:hypothetical protein [Micromonospora sp. NPDC049102]|uniref:hypothetical protein n=1 Tax=Micromonospora sp. NPDC049102 TaxID=3364265 RepID=UPI0037206C3D
MTIGDAKVTIRKGDQALDKARMSVEKASAKLADASALALATLHERIAAAKKHAAAYLTAIG